MPLPHRRFASLVLLCLLAVRPAAEDPAMAVAESKKLVAEGKAEEALERIQLALEYDPESVPLLDAAARACLALERKDEAYWYATLGLDSADDSKEAKALLGPLGELAAQLAPATASPAQLLEDYAENLFKLAQTCQRKKLWANAVEFLVRCEGTRFEKRADDQLESLFSNKKAVEALLDSGIDIPAKPVTKKSARWISREDKKHADWDSAYEIKTDFYTVKTNMGYEMAQSMSLAMEQMNRFYRKVFQYKERGGSMRRCVLNVYATRAEFDEREEKSPSIKGFFRPSENSVTTYDPRTEGGPIGNLWSTLFHEASHQFTHAVSSNLTPAWLNEGTASYFEGANLLPSGFIETNQIPPSRLRNLLILLSQGSPSVREVVSYFQPGSYPGEYYPFGWGLNYFIQNYENEKGERVYVPIYQDYWKSYKSGGEHDPFERFVEYFVKKAAQPGVTTFEEFEERWKSWIRELGEIYNGGQEKADLLIARARMEVANKKPEYAVESYRWALQKRADDARAQFELADVLLGMDQPDGAMHSFRRVISIARDQEDASAPLTGFDDQSAAQVVQTSLERITKIDRNVGEGIAAADEAFATAVGDAARGFAEAGYPYSALYLLQTSRTVLGGDGRLGAQSNEIREASGADLRRWRRPRIEDGLELWEGSKDWRAAGENIRLETDGLVSCVYREDVPDTYRYELTIKPGKGGDFPVYGLVFGANQVGMQMFAVLPEANLVGLVALKSGPEITERFGTVPEIKDGALALAVEVSPTLQTFWLDGKKVGERSLPASEVRGRIGVFGQDLKADFEGLRLYY